MYATPITSRYKSKRRAYFAPAPAKRTKSIYRKKRSTKTLAAAKAKAQPYKQIARNNTRARYNTQLALKSYRLAKQAYMRSFGPVQHQRSKTTAPMHPTFEYPVAFCMTNPKCGIYGCRLYQNEHVTQQARMGANFGATALNACDNKFNWMKDNAAVEPNGPEFFLKYMKYEFDLTGFLTDDYIRIDIVKPNFNFWNENTAQYQLPYCLKAFQNLAGPCSINSIPKKYFTVLKTKTFYMNVRAQLSDLQGAEDFQNEIPGTTGHRFNFKYYHPVNRKIKLQPATHLDQDDGGDKTISGQTNHQVAVPQEVNSLASATGWAAQLWKDQIWAVISCSDTTNITDLVTQDRLNVSVHREMCWRDIYG